MKSHNIKIVIFVGAAIALLSYGVLSHRFSYGVLSHRSGVLSPSALAADRDSLSAARQEVHSGVVGIVSAAPDSSVRMTIGTAPPNFEPKQRNLEAAFAAEALDPDWRYQKFRELSETLTSIDRGLASAQIDCKSATCRVEIASRDAETPQERVNRLKGWFEEVQKLGFNRVDTEFSPDGARSLSYLSAKPLNLTPQLPPELPPEVAESFRKALRDNEHKPIAGVGVSSTPTTWVGGTPDRAVQPKE